jgi:hypothetical protein
MISKEYGGEKRTIRSLFGRQFGEEFGEVLLLRLNFGRTVFGTPDPTASENLVVDRTVVGQEMIDAYCKSNSLVELRLCPFLTDRNRQIVASLAFGAFAAATVGHILFRLDLGSVFLVWQWGSCLTDLRCSAESCGGG